MGISLLIISLSGDWISLSLLYILLNIPLFLLGYRSFSLRFLLISLLGMGIFSCNLEWTAGMSIPTREPLLAAILGGILSGSGSGLYLRFGGSVGGLDILGAFLKKKFSIPIGNTFILVNLVIIVANGFLYDLDIALYTGIFMYVFSWSLQRVQTGFSQRKAVFIISKKPEEVAEKVLRKMDRGLTYFHAYGGLEHEPREVIYTVINLLELGRLKQYLYEIDPDAFMAVNDTAEVIGKRFLSWEEEGFNPIRKKSTTPKSA
jgi:uncharacterized membrane-anchored protein YitT (DUF2179 family)